MDLIYTLNNLPILFIILFIPIGTHSFYILLLYENYIYNEYRI